jgi:hypothetical protein
MPHIVSAGEKKHSLSLLSNAVDIFSAVKKLSLAPSQAHGEREREGERKEKQ